MARRQARCGRISFSEQGTGFPLVLLYASRSDCHDSDLIIPALAERYRVIAVGWPWPGIKRSAASPRGRGGGGLLPRGPGHHRPCAVLAGSLGISCRWSCSLH
jgi:hypothetical protein